MRSAVIAYLLGVIWLQTRAELPPLPWLGFAAASVVAGSLIFVPGRRRRLLRRGITLVTVLALGFFWAAGRAEHRLDQRLTPELEGRDLHVVGVISGLPQQHERGVRFGFEIEKVADGVALPARVQLNWYGRSTDEEARAAAVPVLRAGERWSLVVRLKRPHGTVNPHAFDYELWLLEEDIGATGYVRRDPGNRLIDTLVWRPGLLVDRVRELLRERIGAILGDRPCAGVIVALAVGDQAAIPAAQWQVFNRTGVNHLMSISGLHITMVAALVAGLAGFGWRRSRWALRVPALKAAALAGLAAAFGYALLAGFGVPAQRTVLMLAVVALALLRGVETAPSTVLSVALLVVVVADPWAVTAPGFWLSFGAVAAILFVTSWRIGRPHWLAEWGRVQWAVTLGLTPLLLALFQQVSLASPLANAIAIPVVSLVVVPLTLAGCVPPFGFLLPVAERVLGLCMGFLTVLSASEASVWESHAPSLWAVVLALTGVIWLLLPRGFPTRWVGCVLLLPLFASRPQPLPEGALRLTVLDVGQGLAVVAQTHAHALLYDAGPDYTGDADAGNRIVVPFLRASGVTRLDGLVLSHDDSDHIGGAASVLQTVPIGWIVSSLPDEHPLRAPAAASGRCLGGQQWEWDGVRFEMLSPAPGDDFRGRSDNDSSCVLKMTAATGSALLPGDIERRAETELVARVGDRVRSTLLIAPHHGSRTSSSDALLDAVRPATVVFTAGYRNRFGHPKPEVIARYRDRDIDMLRSDRDGALRVDFTRDGVRVTRWRQAERRYWRDDPPR
ncbi:MAG: DNA internalization-related competence protein ComEC/Rec2 [Betaproteobacteria bacterium]|nr:DNA internalization-related competence protein ComEC/Rec2 [Betaproteobacteria bacterium]